MKKMKKLLVLILSVLMVLGTSATVFAAGETTTGKSISLTGGKAGHTYTLYQIFTGKVETVEGKEQLTNIQWGSDANATFRAAFSTAAAAAKEYASDPEKDADGNSAIARSTAQTLIANNYLGTGTPKALADDGKVEFTGLAEGYYVIVDTNGNQQVVEGDYSSAYIVQVVKDVTGEIKGSGASSDKKVKNKDGSFADANTDAAAWNIGDDVPFQLTATTADNVAAYKKYHITFQDKQSAGLDAPTSYTVKVLGKTFTVPATGEDPAAQTTDNGTKITVTKATPDSGNTFAIKVEFEPVAVGSVAAAPYLNSECNSKEITVDYTSKLNSSAEIGLPGNDNKMHITFSNNPESNDGHEEGKTPDDKVVVFTYKTVVDKVDADGNKLKGAGFTIYQEVAEGTTGAVAGSDIQFEEGIEHSKIAANKYYLEKAMTNVSGKDAQFEFKGLADGKYVLVETTVPEGFNPFNSVEFTISSTVKETEIKTLTGGTPFTTTNPGEDGDIKYTKKDKTEHALDSGELFAEIENNSGTELPSTGGMGTTILYIIGGALVVGCAIMLIAKKRTENK